MNFGYDAFARGCHQDSVSSLQIMRSSNTVCFFKIHLAENKKLGNCVLSIFPELNQKLFVPCKNFDGSAATKRRWCDGSIAVILAATVPPPYCHFTSVEILM